VEAGLMKNHVVNKSWIDWWLYPWYFIRTILSVPFCPLPFCPRTLQNVWSL